MTLTAFMTGNGPLYLDMTEIAFIGAPVQKGRQEESRQVGLRGGGFVYIHNDTENYAKLLPMLPADAPKLAKKIPAVLTEKPKRGRLVKKGDGA